MIYSISEIRKVLEKELRGTPVKQAILFGSYAKGCPRVESDLDLVVDMDGKHQNFAFWGVYEILRTPSLFRWSCLKKARSSLDKRSIWKLKKQG